jgi:hypothetical protein
MGRVGVLQPGRQDPGQQQRRQDDHMLVAAMTWQAFRQEVEELLRGPVPAR